MFTDELLAPTRTTRQALDPLRQYDEVVLNDELLVDVMRYGVIGQHWCRCVGVSPGSASVYPFKVQVPGRGVGQFRAGEVVAWRRPVWLHEAIVEGRKYSGIDGRTEALRRFARPEPSPGPSRPEASTAT